MALKRLMDEKKTGNGPDKQAVLTAKLKASTARARAHLVRSTTIYLSLIH
jgi:hypothetical protein